MVGFSEQKTVSHWQIVVVVANMLFIIYADLVSWCQSYHETGYFVP